MPPKHKPAPASTAPKRTSTRATKGKRQTSEAPAVAHKPDRGIARRTRSANPASSAPITPVKSGPSLADDPVARRNAPPQSELDIPSTPPRNEDDDEESEDQDEDQDEDEEGEEMRADEDVGADEGEQEAVIQVDDEYVQFMDQQVVKLANTAESILIQYKVFSDKDKIARLNFELAMDTLGAVRIHFIVDESCAPFLQSSWLRGRTTMPEDHVARFKTALILANLATLFEIIYAGAQDNGKESRRADADKLRILDENFADLLLGGDHLAVTQLIVNLALDIRAARLLAALADARKNLDARTMAYRIFCEVSEEAKNAPADKMTHALMNGPYAPVAGRSGEETVNNRCRGHVARFLKHIGNDDAAFANLSIFRKKQFPAQSLLATIQATHRELVQARSQSAHSTTSATRNSPQEEFHDAASELPDGGDGGDGDSADDSSDNGESQPIVRLSDTQTGPSLFQDAADIELLDRAGPSALPPSNQQASRGGTLPVDHTATPLSARLARRQRLVDDGLASSSPQQQRRKHTPYQATPDDDDDDDDVFETDTRRPVDAEGPSKRRRYETQQAMRVERYHREQQRQQQQTQSIPFPSSHAAPPLSASTTIVVASTQRPGDNAPKSSTVAPSSSSRLAAIHGGRQRTFWSDRDAQMLARAVGQFYGKWSLIAKHCATLLEHPRDQQACRDKARNMKTELLLTDQRLPDGFDFVALGPKERRKLVAFGKNPGRLEADVDLVTGEPTNTEYVEGQAI